MLTRDDIITFCEEIQFKETIKTSDIQKMVSIGYTKAISVLLDLQEKGMVERMKKNPESWRVNKETIRKYLLLNTAN